MNKQRLLNFYYKSFLIGLFFLLTMSIYRFIFYVYYNPNIDASNFYTDLINSFILGIRLDLTVVGYSFFIAFLLSLVFYILRKDFYDKVKYFFLLYFIVLVTIMGADFGFYSYFKEHINILFFGLFDDDTQALVKTFFENYNVALILILYFTVLFIGYKTINKIFTINKYFDSFFYVKNIFIIFVLVFILIFIFIRGTFGMYPLGKMLPNVSKEKFINQTSNNSFRTFIKAYKLRKKFYSNNYDLISDVGYSNNLIEAFKLHSIKNKFDSKELLNNITYKTSKDIKDGMNVVVVMVESFGMPILKYNNESFDLLRSLKKHFDEDLLFRNFISSGDGTIASLESLILGITYRPNSFPFSQSLQKQTSYNFSPAFTYKNKGYETNFIYGGDLTWRDIGSFIKYQGFDKVYGKISIYNSLEKEKEKDYFHPWGIYDEYLFNKIEKKLLNAKKPQFIFALTTNNHPPYNIPNHYNSKKLVINKNLKSHITGDIELAKQRFYSYQYALDQVGKFLNRLKNSKLKDNTIVVITADNNTIDGIMKYDKNHILNSKNIPFLLYTPPSIRQKANNMNLEAFASHKDIFPTLFNLTLSDTKYISIGNNLLNHKSKFIAFNGSKVVISKNGSYKVEKLNKRTDNNSIEYYRATLAVQEYLLNQYK